MSGETVDRAALIEALERLCKRHREAERDEAEEAILDVLDMLTGHCAKAVRL